MKSRAFQQVDVFGATPYLGNPLAVVLDGSGLSDDEMQHFAQWTHLSETTFLLPPSAAAAARGADYRVRIFTPGAELPFAGHPTLGSCHAWLQAGGKPRACDAASGRAVAEDVIVQECAIGLIRIRRQGTRLAFAAPPLKRCNAGPELLAKVVGALGLQSNQILATQLLDNGPLWLCLLLDSEETVLQLRPDHGQLRIFGQKVGVVAVQQARPATILIARSNREGRAFAPRLAANDALIGEASVVVRAFAAPVGVDEDPVTGSLNASLAQWLIAEGYAPATYVASQGHCLGRAGRVYIEHSSDGQVWVGGDSVTCIDGTVNL